MKYFLFSLLWICIIHFTSGQILKQASWQQKVDYDIKVRLIDSNNTLEGSSIITYSNNSPDTLKELYIHLWTNAYRDNQTPFAKQQVRTKNTKFYYSKEEDKGNVQVVFAEGGNEVKPNYIKDDQEIAILKLAKPILPGQSRNVETTFKVKLPKEFSRMGSGENSYGAKDYQITQWFPKVAMYDVNGWHPFNYLDLGEFYDNFGDYKVSITVPSQYMVAATGEMQFNKKELEWRRDTRGVSNVVREGDGTLKTLVFEQENVHDFAWFASNAFKEYQDSVKLESGNVIQTYFYSTHEDEGSMEALKNALKFYSSELGDYPYKACSVVEGALSAGGGMEYPMITVISYMTDRVIVHEVGHNWFQGILGTNERRYPWMDEGVNSYYENLYFKRLPKGNSKTGIIPKLLEDSEEAQSYFICRHQHNLNETQACGLHSDDYTELNYGGIIYGKVALMFEYLKTDLGEDLFTKCMKEYYSNWKFKHPLPGNMQSSFEKTAGKDLSWFFDDAINNNRKIEMRSSGPVILPHGKDVPKLERSLAITPLSLFEKPEKRYLYVLPAIGWNEHNKIMAGLNLSNEMVLPKKTKFSLTPLYSFEDKNINGFASIETKIAHKGKKLYRTDIGINTQAFDYTVFGDKLHYTRIKPYVAFNLREKTKQKYGKINRIELAGYFINSSGDSADRFRTNQRMHLLTSYIYDDNSVINNTKLKAALEYGKDGLNTRESSQDYVKASLTWKQELNYNKKGKKLKFRVFAGKFFHKSDTSVSGDYHYNLSNNTGSADYLMDDLFLFRSPGINKTDFHSRQLVEKGGAMRNPVYALRTDAWLFALNIENTLPGKIPLRPYLDVGMGRMGAGAGGKFEKDLYYTGGLAIIIAEDILEVYLPLLSSQQLVDQYDFSNIEFHQRISFKLNIPLLNPLKSLKL